MKKILCVTDKCGWCLYNIMNILKKHISKYHIDIITLKDKFNPKKYDLVYYTHFSLYDKRPCKNKKIATITSHKCLNDIEKTLKKLSVFDGISVNSFILFNIFEKKLLNLYYTPSGVDTVNFNFKNKNKNNKLVFGWVGNKDRLTKNYNIIFKPLQKSISDVIFKEVATCKKDTIVNLLNCKQMINFYHSLDFFLITSSTEGTPNPGLEALSCGVPVISTRVGNMVDIIENGVNGFFCDDNLQSFIRYIEKVKDISYEEYNKMSICARESILSWDWSIIYKKYMNFFRDFL